MARWIAEVRDERQAASDKYSRLRDEASTIERSLVAHGSLTSGEEERLDRITRGMQNAAEEISRLRDEELDMIRSLAERGSTEGGADGMHYGGGGINRARGNSERDQALRTIERSAKDGFLPDHAAEKTTALVERSGLPKDQALAARWVVAAGDELYRSAFCKMLADPIRGHLLWTAQEQAAYQAAANVQGELSRAASLTDASGGYMVPLTLDPAIMLTSAGSINPLRQISRVVQTVTDQWQGVSSAGVTAEWKAEAAEAADAAPTLAAPSIPVHFGDAFVPYSFEVGMDARDFLSELREALVDGADQLQATAYTTGTGSGQPTGIITALTGTSSIVASAGADAFAKGDVYNVQNNLPPRFSARAQWCANIATINLMSQMETSAGARLFPELSNGRLLNKPINELSNMDGAINATQENYMLLYGDFRNFVIVDRIGTTLELIPNLVGANRRPTGQRGALLWFRTGSDSVVDNAFRLLNVT
ncbi:phage major capsid protein [Micromonospora chersina]|uniref:phage major capsid protein n=1 Tax=Micromonospora chersina TaxID=47854 RepID=UPI003D8C64E9